MRFFVYGVVKARDWIVPDRTGVEGNVPDRKSSAQVELFYFKFQYEI